jgi:capsule polysaccharide export protein KpsE/RkpR
MKTHALTIVSVALLSLAAGGLSGCQSSCTGDPRFDNYWCARGNLSDGTYARQTADLRQTAADRQIEAASLRARLETRQAQLASARSQNSSSAEIRRLEGEIATLRQQISTLNR